MVEMEKWIARKFPYAPPAGEYPMIVERLRGTPARLEEKMRELPTSVLTRRLGEVWSIQENVGHLLDLEPLWARRLQELLSGTEELCAADLSNRKTHEADHNHADLDALLSGFRAARRSMLARLDELDNDMIVRSALHPRLKHPMRTIDLCLFVAEHDDHHLARITELVQVFARA